MNRHAFLHVKNPCNNYTENGRRRRTKFSRPDDLVTKKCAPLVLTLWKYKLTKNILLKFECTTNVRTPYSAKTSHSTVVRPTNLRRRVDIKCSKLAVWPTKFISNDHFFIMEERPYWARASSLRMLYYHRHTILGRIPLDERSARRGHLYLTTHDTPSAEFEPAIPAKRAAADPRLRQRGNWDRFEMSIPCH